MRRRRDPDTITLQVLVSHEKGTRQSLINRAQGDVVLLLCVAVGFMPGAESDQFDLAADIVALTHGDREAWEAGGALAVAATLSCCDDFQSELEQAIIRSGHSRTSAAVCGALLGVAAISSRRSGVEWLPQHGVIELLAVDFALELSSGAPDQKIPDMIPLSGGKPWALDASPPIWWWLRYPGWRARIAT